MDPIRANLIARVIAERYFAREASVDPIARASLLRDLIAKGLIAEDAEAERLAPAITGILIAGLSQIASGSAIYSAGTLGEIASQALKDARALASA